MELWVRSQDKETLIKSYELYIRPYSNIYVIRAKRTSNIMGLYKSKERALEILDEIQIILHPTVFMSAEINTDDNNWVENGIIYQKYKDNFKIQELSTYVYQMPEE